MKNNILGALVIFFAVVACLLIIDDLSYKGQAQLEYPLEQDISKQETNDSFATTELETED